MFSYLRTYFYELLLHVQNALSIFKEILDLNLPYSYYPAFLKILVLKGYAHTAQLTKQLTLLKNVGLRYEQNSNLYDVLIEFYNKPLAKKIPHAEKFTHIFVKLKNTRFSFTEYKLLYQTLIDNAYYSENLLNAFVKLKSAGIPFNKNKDLYQALIEHAKYSVNLANAFVKLKNADIPFNENKDLYQVLINNPYCTEQSINAFIKLKNADFPVNEYKDLYHALINHASYAVSLSYGFFALKNAGLPYNENNDLYEHLIKNPSQAEKLGSGFANLNHAGILFNENKILYQVLINHAAYAVTLSYGFLILKNAGLLYRENNDLYKYLIKTPSQTEKLAKGFLCLKNNRLPFNENKALYQALTNHASYATSLCYSFVILKNAGLPYNENNVLYQYLTQNPTQSEKLAKGFVMLKNDGLPFSENKVLYQMLINKSSYTEPLANSFILLNNAHFSFQKNEPLFQLLTEHASHAKFLANTFVHLKKIGFDYDENKELYETLIKNKGYAHILHEEFMKLHSFKEENKYLYEALIHNAPYARILNAAFCFLKNNNFPYKENINLYEALIKKISPIKQSENLDYKTFAKLLLILKSPLLPVEIKDKLLSFCCETTKDAPSLIDALYILVKLEIPYKDYPRCYTINMLERDPTYFISILTQIRNRGFMFDSHKIVYDAILKRIDASGIDKQIALSISKKVSEYATSHPLFTRKDKRFSAQISELEELIHEVESNQKRILLGPLRKSKGTEKIEELLTLISQGKETEIEYNELGHYILTRSAEKPINLTYLIRHANLSQLELSENLIESLGIKIEELLNDNLKNDWNSFIGNNMPLLHPVQQKSIIFYTTERYKNINKMFRGEPFSTKNEYLFSSDPIKDRLVCFLLGCLLNDAARKLTYLPSRLTFFSNQTKFKSTHQEDVRLIALADKISSNASLKNQYSHQKKELTAVVLDRGERLTPEIINKRQANPWALPALTSFSLSKTGSSYFHNQGTRRTKLHIDSFGPIIINQAEEEVILPHGEQIITQLDKNGRLVSSLVRSPSFFARNHYWSDVALTDAYLQYLSKEYSQMNSTIMLDGKPIVRPNHNVTHLFRVMTMIEHVVDYFAEHAADHAFRTFCQELTDKQIECLRIGAVFSITGRESEISAGENLALYDTYREASASHFNQFVESHETGLFDETMKARMHHVVRYMGNPHYENGQSDHDTINQHPDSKEKTERNFYHRILTMAHKLDLPRCYHSIQYLNSLSPCRELCIQNEAQKSALSDLIRYNIELIKAHGGHLNCDILPNGTMKDVSISYDKKYAESSLSFKRLYEMSETVTKPRKEWHLKSKSPVPTVA